MVRLWKRAMFDELSAGSLKKESEIPSPGTEKTWLAVAQWNSTKQYVKREILSAVGNGGDNYTQYSNDTDKNYKEGQIQERHRTKTWQCCEKTGSKDDSNQKQDAKTQFTEIEPDS